MNDDRKFQEKKAWLLLLLNAGMPYDTIEKVLGISPLTARSYIRKLQDAGEWKGKVSFLSDAKPIMLKHYADIIYGEKRGIYDPKFKEKVVSVLAELLEEKKIVEILCFSLPGINSFSQLKYADDVPMGYQNLLKELWIWMPFQSFGWREYLVKISSGKLSLPHPKEFVWGNDHYLHKIIQSSADETRRYYIAPILTKRICQHIDDKIAECLYGKQEEVIKLFFGLDGDPKTIEEIGKGFDLTTNRTKQIKDMAIRRLKDQILFMNPISDAWETIHSLNDAHKIAVKKLKDEFIQTIYQLEHPEQEEPIVISELDILKREVVYEDLSVRLLNCLKAADIYYIWQLLMITKADLLKYRNFGKKSLAELDEYLKEKNLHLGWEFSPAEIAHLELETTKKV